ncbi:putative zn 2cys6 transcription factor protein [Phaeoacremonium minimum UCRPA7]|uniref:Putative zn 2cys6 transcription factor protein n=1 Tax=Phaeoacremonium minimum (strain UCR-PA7) TaxID=1286976 RepID=R8BEB4_PHAM7|nr:putative zn 2cys6 transcription factor protein [Phaeoacremonium minimum UCRPA7]EON97649.1 putative zn 2cys6 transcription factor protein [Phaeoacremonium minimum UCRPA7]
MFCQLSHCFILLFKLSTLEDPSWDKSLVRQTVDVVELLEKFAAVMGETPAAAGFLGDPEVIGDQNIFFKSSRIMRALATNWRKDLDGEQTKPVTDGLGMPNEQQTPFVSGEIDEYFMMNLANDQWLSDIFVSLNGSA